MKTKHIAITGTRHGANKAQLALLEAMLCVVSEPGVQMVMHNGLCCGVDAQAHDIATWLSGWSWNIVGHPSNSATTRQYLDCTELREPLPPLKRDKIMVNESQLLIGVPEGLYEERRSGTWTTIRHAIKTAKPFYVIYPNGEITYGRLRPE